MYKQHYAILIQFVADDVKLIRVIYQKKGSYVNEAYPITLSYCAEIVAFCDAFTVILSHILFEIRNSNL